jgi:hypothetical protein
MLLLPPHPPLKLKMQNMYSRRCCAQLSTKHTHLASLLRRPRLMSCVFYANSCHVYYYLFHVTLLLPVLLIIMP